MMILVAGPYRSGTGDDPAKMLANVRLMEAYALPLFRAGHIPIVGEWLALPLVALTGSRAVGDEPFNEIFHPIAERLLERCDAVLRVGGPSAGADLMVKVAQERSLAVFHALREVPGCQSMAEPTCPGPRLVKFDAMELIRKGVPADSRAISALVNDAAQAYRGVIPADRWHEPYMPMNELEKEISGGVVFWVAELDGRLLGVMGVQDKGDVALVRHAYVSPTWQRSGVGTRLLRHVEGLTDKPILIGTWASASWAIDFYRRNGFSVVSNSEKDRLLRTYWSIPARQVETSVVLADERWMQANPRR